jgi:hypothetical protein
VLLGSELFLQCRIKWKFHTYCNSVNNWLLGDALVSECELNSSFVSFTNDNDQSSALAKNCLNASNYH